MSDSNINKPEALEKVVMELYEQAKKIKKTGNEPYIKQSEFYAALNKAAEGDREKFNALKEAISKLIVARRIKSMNSDFKKGWMLELLEFAYFADPKSHSYVQSTSGSINSDEVKKIASDIFYAIANISDDFYRYPIDKYRDEFYTKLNQAATGDEKKIYGDKKRAFEYN